MDPEAELAATPHVPICDVDSSFIMDIGAVEDLIPASKAQSFAEYHVQESPLVFSTANGPLHAETQFPIWIPEFRETARS